MNVWWNGAAIDRLLDERHATMVNEAINVVDGLGWSTQTEITFSEYGERGSLDLFAAKPAVKAVLVGEVKSEWGSMEETLRLLDVKTRLAHKLAVAQLWVRTSCDRPRSHPARGIDGPTHRRSACGHARCGPAR